MRASRSFVYGDEEGTRTEFKAGEEVPNKIAKELPDHLLLEKMAESSPEELSKEQLMRLAGVGPYQEDPAAEVHVREEEESELNEDDLREALDALSTKRDILDWAKEFAPDADLEMSMTRDAMTDAVVESLLYEEVDEDEEEDDDDED